MDAVSVPFGDNLAGFRGRPGDSQHGIIMARFWLADKLTHSKPKPASPTPYVIAQTA